MKRATCDLDAIRAWAASPEGIEAIKAACEWARRKGRQLERAQRVSPARMDRRVTY